MSGHSSPALTRLNRPFFWNETSWDSDKCWATADKFPYRTKFLDLVITNPRPETMEEIQLGEYTLHLSCFTDLTLKHKKTESKHYPTWTVLLKVWVVSGSLSSHPLLGSKSEVFKSSSFSSLVSCSWSLPCPSPGVLKRFLMTASRSDKAGPPAWPTQPSKSQAWQAQGWWSQVQVRLVSSMILTLAPESSDLASLSLVLVAGMLILISDHNSDGSDKWKTIKFNNFHLSEKD